MRIFLVGFMGSGKTTFGKKLASSLNYPLFDLDQEIEAIVNQSVPEYFAAHGEESFRMLEKQTLQEGKYPEDCVISCGGGSPCYFDNMDWMNLNGVTVYLEMAPLALASRLKKKKYKRPLIKDLDEAGLLQFIETKLAERLPFYSKAKLTIGGIDINTELVKDQILNSGS